MTTPFRGTAVFPEVAQRLLYTEFNRFQERFDAGADDEEQEMRAGALLWWATFSRSVFPALLRREIRALVLGVSSDVDERAWLLVVSLRGALAWLDADDAWLAPVIPGLAHHASAVRRRVAEQMALAAPRIAAGSAELRRAVRENYEQRHFFADEALAIYAASGGSRAEKRSWLSRWSGEVDPEAPGADALSALLGGGAAPNPFAVHVTSLERYQLLRLATEPGPPPLQMTAIGADSGISCANRDPAGRVWDRLRAHPLVGPAVELVDAGATLAMP